MWVTAGWVGGELQRCKKDSKNRGLLADSQRLCDFGGVSQKDLLIIAFVRVILRTYVLGGNQ